MIKCPHCGELMTEAYVFKHLPDDMVVSEGARLMSLRNPHKISGAQARKAALARWKPYREWLAQQNPVPEDPWAEYQKWKKKKPDVQPPTLPTGSPPEGPRDIPES